MALPSPSPTELVRQASDSARKAYPVPTSMVEQQPALIRGLSNTSPQNKPGLAALVAKAMSQEDVGWGSVDASKVGVTDVSGQGGSMTFKVTAPEGAPVKQRSVALHCRPSDKNESFMRRMSLATQVFGHHGVGPRRIAEGADWFVETWDAVGKVDDATPEGWQKIGNLLGRVHQVPVEWFDSYRNELFAKVPSVKAVPNGSHAWIFFTRHPDMSEFGSLTDDPAFLAEYVDAGPFGPTHEAAKRVVTTHGDFHPGNMIDMGANVFHCVDFEMTCVSTALHDLAFGVACCGGDSSNERAFLSSYLETMGDASDTIDSLLVDCRLGLMWIWHSGGKLAAWSLGDKEAGMQLIQDCKAFASEVRASDEKQRELRVNGFQATIGAHPLFCPLSKMAKDRWYMEMQAKLTSGGADCREVAVGVSDARAVAMAPITDEDVVAAVAAGGKLVTIKVKSEQSLVLQVKPGTARLELGQVVAYCPNVAGLQLNAQPVGGDKNQQWLRSGDLLQHVGTGLFLDTAIRYAYFIRGAPWKEAGSELCVTSRDTHSDRQRWVFDGPFIRHLIDGRALDVNAWVLQVGQGVNCNVPHTSAIGASWVVDGADESDDIDLCHQSSKGTWAEYSNIDMCGQGDVEIIGEWRASTTVEKLKRVVERKGYSSITVSSGEPSFGHAALKRFDYQLQPTHCKPITECCRHPCTLYIYTPPAGQPDGAAANPRPEIRPPLHQPPPPIAPIPEGAVFHIKPALAHDFCISVRAGKEGAFEVYLAKVDGAAKQKWRLVDGDQIQNADSGQFLDTDVKYQFLVNIDEIWEGNHTDLRTRPRNFSDSQKWVLGPEAYHGGLVMRHFKDGRAVDVHGWQFSDGGKMGCENSVHADCRGISYIFCMVDA